MGYSPQLHHHLLFYRLVCSLIFLIVRSITSHWFVLNMVQGHYFQLRSFPALFCNFQQFSSKVAAAHHPIIQKEVDKMFAKGTVEPSSGGAGFYSSVFVVPKYSGGLQPILNLKQFNHYMHIPSSKMHTIRHVQQLIQCSHYAFSIDLQDTYLHTAIVKHHHYFYNSFGKICCISRQFYL